MDTTVGNSLVRARDVLQATRDVFERALRALADTCSADGRVDDGKLDAYQVPAYELAWVAAELVAAETSVQDVWADDRARADDLEVRLVLLFAVDAVAAIIGRLEAVYADLELDRDALRALADNADWLHLRQSAGAMAALQQVGQAVAASDADVGATPLDDGHAMAQESFRRFSQDVVAPQAESIHRNDLIVPETLLQPLRDMGVFGLSIPESYGGSGPDKGDDTLLMVIVTEALSEGSLAAAGSLITRPEILSRALLTGGTDAQKAQWLPRLAAGDPLCAIAITEPDFGSDVAALNLKATPAGDGWLLNGAKTWCTFAGKAGLLMVVARTDPDKSLGHRGLSLILVEKPSFEAHDFEVIQDSGGSLRGRAIPTIGYRGMHSFDLAFDDYFVPAENVVGGEAGLGKGFYYTMAGMVGGRMQTAVRACGVMRAALRATIRYVADRRLFGTALGELPLTQAKLARMAARLAACRRLTYATAAVVDRGEGRMQASLVKLLACRSAELVTREALQLHGGMGYAEETPVSRYFVDARVLSIFEGAEETLALKVIARNLIADVLTSTVEKV